MYTRLPMFQRIGSAAYKANLDNTIALCELLDNPEGNFKSIHIAGTNGKGQPRIYSRPYFNAPDIKLVYILHRI